MPIDWLHVSGYRSIREVQLRLNRLNVLTGPNGCGKSNLYQSMYLLSAAANGNLARTLAEEGGMPSTLWAGPVPRLKTKKEPVRVSLRVELEDLDYELRFGIVTPPGHVTREDPTKFLLDPEVKEEKLTTRGRRGAVLMERDGGTAWIRDSEGRRQTFPFDLNNAESILAQIQEPYRFPQLSAISQEIRNWRFYHYFPTDAAAPQRHPQVGVRTPILDRNGRHLAAALQTIYEVGDGRYLNRAIDDAFPGAKLLIQTDDYTRFRVELQMPEINRPFEARELSDGTLRYLCLLAALLSPRPPSLLALNEPETSLHPDLLAPLARLICEASRFSQIWITTHSLPLAEAIEDFSGQKRIRLEKVDGETRIVGQNSLGEILD